MTCASDISFVILFAIFYVTSICNTITFLEIVLFIWVISWGVEEIRQIKDASKYEQRSKDRPLTIVRTFGTVRNMLENHWFRIRLFQKNLGACHIFWSSKIDIVQIGPSNSIDYTNGPDDIISQPQWLVEFWTAISTCAVDNESPWEPWRFECST